MSAHYAMCDAEDPQELARICESLLDYCRLDTLGMTRIVAKLRKLVR